MPSATTVEAKTHDAFASIYNARNNIVVGKSYVGTIRELRLYQNSTFTFDEEHHLRLLTHLDEPHLVAYWALFQEELIGSAAVDWTTGGAQVAGTPLF